MPVQLGTFDSEQKVTQFVLSNGEGSLLAKFIDHGATLTNLLVADREGVTRDVVLGFDSLDGYLSPLNRYMGATIGRVANRIAKGVFELNGEAYELAINNGPNSLHGGLVGFDSRKWTGRVSGESSVEFTLDSADGDQNYPGTLEVKLVYSIVGKELHLDYEAKLVDNEKTKKSTIINMTNHTYFNLGGCTDKGTAKIFDHFVTMTDQVTGWLEKDTEVNIPTGRVVDFSRADAWASCMYFGPNPDGTVWAAGQRIDEASGGGYDHCYVIGKENDGSKDVVKVWSPQTGISVSMRTTEPSFQLYCGDHNPDELLCKESQNNVQFAIGRRSGLCLEAQRFPDAINKDNWKKQVILSPGQTYTQKTVYTFGLITDN